jgi:drug/metabolite transporter (DMT)-like permease
MRLALADPLLWFAGLLILLGVICWYLSMTRLPLSLMLPLAAAIAPVVSVGAYFLLGEVLTPAKIAAIAMITVGVSWLGWLNA